MRNIKLTVEYDGTDYAGWQRQSRRLQAAGKKPKTKNQKSFHNGHRQINTIQGTIEETLEKILQEKINLIGSGRTDAGVHALGQVANFKTKTSLSINSLQMGLNSLLPNDVVVKEIEEVKEDFHSRYSAKSKVYRYAILNNSLPSPLLRRQTYFYPYPLNLVLLKREAKRLSGKHNFKSFCASGSGTKNTIRTIKKISVKRNSFSGWKLVTGDWKLVTIVIEADGFLYKMVRNIVGTLIDINRKKINGIKEVLVAADRKKAGQTAPSQGLCLLKVKYT